ncbi:MAG: division/cell wall cluster transcriptional repressor MraZ [Eggerthellaceae bacterium]|nr:division/cell wall cluster transcriptional repressor MraZ [Eggerthellaceae bacterium]
MDEARKRIDLNGEFRFKVDAKGRMSLPSKFRKSLAEDLVVTPDLDSEHLMVFEERDFNDWVESLFVDRYGGFHPSNAKHLNMRRALKARSFNVEVDSAGRILLPADQRALAHIDRDVVIVGNTGYFEVWDAKRYGEKSAQVDLTELLVRQ